MKRKKVIVIGGGPAGVCAAIAAAEEGAETLLLEETGEPGGTGGPGGVHHWLGGRTPDCREFMAGGLFRRLVTRAADEGIALLPVPPADGSCSPHGWGRGPHYLTAGIPFDGVRMGEFLERNCREAGVRIRYFTRFIDCTREGDRIGRLRIHDRGGFSELEPDFVIDASGDAAAAVCAGVPFETGREKDHLTAPATLEFQVSRVDHAALSRYVEEQDSPRFLKEIRRLREKGIWNFPYDRFIAVQLNEPDVFMINTSRLTGIDGLSGEGMTDVMIRGRREAVELFAVMKKHFPGFGNARLQKIASLPGIRESRRIRGKVTLRAEDLLKGKKFPCTIGFSCYTWDLPDPVKPSFQPMAGREFILPDRIPLPFGIMEPETVKNLLCPGRAVSVEREVLGPVRVMAACMVMGEAAGAAAASEKRGEALRELLKKRNCIVD